MYAGTRALIVPFAAVVGAAVIFFGAAQSLHASSLVLSTNSQIGGKSCGGPGSTICQDNGTLFDGGGNLVLQWAVNEAGTAAANDLGLFIAMTESVGASSGLEITAGAHAVAEDRLIIAGGSGTGFLGITGGFDGSFTHSTGGRTAGSGGAVYQILSGGSEVCEAAAGDLNITTSATCHGVIPFTFGVPLDVYQGFGVGVGFIADTDTAGSLIADFSHTAQILGLTVVDSNMNPVVGASVVDDSGYQYPMTQSATPVPEPGAVFLLGSGLVCVFHLVRVSRTREHACSRRGAGRISPAYRAKIT